MQTATPLHVKRQFSQESEKVMGMFGRIAHRYDLANALLSFGIHRLWRNSLLSMLPPGKGLRVLDLCTGTGDLVALLSKRGHQVVGADFCLPMLQCASAKSFPVPREVGGSGNLGFIQGSALSLPFADKSFDVVTVSFGVRNFEDRECGLKEIGRVLKSQGRALILEFGQPDAGVWGTLFRIYSRWIIPVLGGWVTGDREAYEYLPATSAVFPCGVEFELMLTRSGLTPYRTMSLFGGVAYAYSACPSEGSCQQWGT